MQSDVPQSYCGVKCTSKRLTPILLISLIEKYIRHSDDPFKERTMKTHPELLKVGRKKACSILRRKLKHLLSYEDIKSGYIMLTFESKNAVGRYDLNYETRINLKINDDRLQIIGLFEDWNAWTPGYFINCYCDYVSLIKPVCSKPIVLMERPPFIMSRAGISILNPIKACSDHVCPNCELFTKSRRHIQCKSCKRGIPLIKTPLFLVKQFGEFPIEVMMQFHYIMRIIYALPNDVSTSILKILKHLHFKH